MQISRYPRVGHRLAPSLLRELLQKDVPKYVPAESGLRLRDLDATAWDRFGKAVCRKLGKAIVDQVRIEWSSMPARVRRRRLSISSSFVFEGLQLESRTFNCLDAFRAMRNLRTTKDWAAIQIGDLCQIRHFGPKSLVDFLTSLESTDTTTAAAAMAVGSEELSRRQHAAFQKWCKRPVVNLPSLIRGMRLPAPPPGATLDSLQLRIRTFHSLSDAGFSSRVAELGDLTLRDILRVRGFGIQCLVDLATSIHRQTAPREAADGSDPACNSLEEELVGLVTDQGGKRKRGRNKRIVVRYFGLDGKGPSTLQRVGDANGVTRERVRQLCLRASKSLSGRTLSLPFLDRTIEFIGRQVPTAIHEVEGQLFAEGLTRRRFRIAALSRIAKLVGRKLPFRIERRQGVITRGEELESVRTARRMVQGIVRRLGIGTTADIIAQCASPSAPSEEELLRLLPDIPHFAWLDQETGWFWLSSEQSRIGRRIRKVLAVSEQIDVAQLRAQITRDLYMRGYAPPRRILLELCRQLPGCEVVNTSIRAVPPINWKTELPRGERIMVRLLRAHGPVIRRHQFEAACALRGVLHDSFTSILSYSPVIARVAPGVYGLAGANHDPGAIESLIPVQHCYPKVRLDHGWTPDGRIWISYRLSETVIVRGVCTVPTAMEQLLEGEFTASAADASRIGIVECKDKSVWGLRPFFRRRGGEAGDCMVTLFDLSKREVTIHIGDDSLVAEYADAADPETSVP